MGSSLLYFFPLSVLLFVTSTAQSCRTLKESEGTLTLALRVPDLGTPVNQMSSFHQSAYVKYFSPGVRTELEKCLDPPFKT
jgi:hypothetical protein